MANRQRGYVEIELDKPRKLRFTLNALSEIEDKLGVSFTEIGEVLKKPKMKDLLVVLWAGLIHEDEDLTIKEVGNMIDISDLEMVSEKLGEAFAAATGEVNQKKDIQKNGTGKK